MIDYIKKIIKFIFPFFLILIGLYLLKSIYNKPEFSFTKINYNYILIYCTVYLIQYYIITLSVPILLGIKNTLVTFYIARYSTIFNNISPLKVGLPVKAYLFKKYLNIDPSHSSGAMSIEISAHITITLFACAIIGINNILDNYKVSYELILLFVLLIVIIIILFLLVISFFSSRVLNFFKKTYRFYLSLLKVPERILYTYIISSLSLLIMIFRMYLLIVASGGEMKFYNVALIILTTNFVSMVSIIPAGYVVRELTGVFLFVQFGLDLNLAAIVLIIDRMVTIVITFSLGIFSYFKLGNIGLVRD